MSGEAAPLPPAGFEALRTGADGSCSLLGPHHGVQITHLIRAGNPTAGTLCGLSLFDGPAARADIRGWSRGGGVTGPDVRQDRCAGCWHKIECAGVKPGTEHRGHATRRCCAPAGHDGRYCRHEDAETLTRLGYRATSVVLWPNPNAAPQAEQWPAEPYVEPTS